MDLSVAASRPAAASDDSGSESGAAAAKPKIGLSVVRPEILFGNRAATTASPPPPEQPPPEPEQREREPEQHQSPLSLLSSLSGILNPAAR